MSDKKSTFLEKLKAMPIDEVIKYESAAVQAGRIIDVIGISCALLMMFFPTILVLMICIPALALIAKMGAVIGQSLVDIREHINKSNR